MKNIGRREMFHFFFVAPGLHFIRVKQAQQTKPQMINKSFALPEIKAIKPKIPEIQKIGTAKLLEMKRNI